MRGVAQGKRKRHVAHALGADKSVHVDLLLSERYERFRLCGSTLMWCLCILNLAAGCTPRKYEQNSAKSRKRGKHYAFALRVIADTALGNGSTSAPVYYTDMFGTHVCKHYDRGSVGRGVPAYNLLRYQKEGT